MWALEDVWDRFLQSLASTSFPWELSVQEGASWASGDVWYRFLRSLPLTFSASELSVQKWCLMGFGGRTIARARQAVWAYGCCMNAWAGHFPSASFAIKLSCRGDRVGRWGSDGHTYGMPAPHLFCLGFTL